MITKNELNAVLDGYDRENITIGVLGGHSALDVCRGAKKYGFKTAVVCQAGREKTYSKYYRAGNGKGIVDDTIVLEKFEGILKPEIQEKLRRMNTIFIHNRYFWVYFDFNKIENEFLVPIFGTRTILKLEERTVPNNQYELLKKAGIRIPHIFKSPEDIDRLSIVKASEAMRTYERSFFFVHDFKGYLAKSGELIKKGIITEDALSLAVIEEYVIGAQVNFNFFYSVLDNELELMGTDTRRQTSLDGILRLTAPEQIEVLKHIDVKYIETGHITCTVKESLLEKAFDAGERFVAATKENHPPGIIGPFALQGAIAAEHGKEELVVFDVSLRIPGSPGTLFTPYSGYLYGESLSYGERIAMEIKNGINENRLCEICT